MHAFASAIRAAESGEHSILLPAAYDLIWGGVSFVIILVLFWKFVLPSMQKVMAERTAKIEGGIARAEAKHPGTTIDLVAFHEVGAIDSIIDTAVELGALEREPDRQGVVALLPEAVLPAQR